MDLTQLRPTPLAPTTPPSAGAVQLFKLLAGDVSQLPTGPPLPATVVRTSGGQTVLTVGGQQLTVNGTLPAAAGEVVSVRVQPGPTPAVTVAGPGLPTTPVASAGVPTAPAPPGRAEAGGTAIASGEGGPARANPSPGGSVPPAAANTPQRGQAGEVAPRPQPASAEPVVVDVLGRQPNGQLRVRIDGREATATSPQPLRPGGRYVVQVDRTPAGIVLRPLPDSPQLPAAVATAILRTDKPPPLGDTLPALVKELAAPPAAAAPVRAAAEQVRDVAVRLLPPADRPPTADGVRQLVEDGGTKFEAKLARAADPSTSDRPAPPAPPTDLKAGLLALARTVPDLAAAFPAAAATLHGIERQQAVSVLNQQTGGMAVVQIPFPDGPHWRTLGLGIEPDRSAAPDAAGRPGGFRVMMHVPLSSLGETWIDATADATRLRAVLYVNDPAARERVRAELPDLRAELRAGGVGEVLLDVRPAADLTEAQRRKANALREGLPEGGGLIDVRA